MEENHIDNAGYQLKAVIDIGSTSVRMVIAEIYKDGTFKALDALNQSVSLGSDTFSRNRISRATIEDCVKAFRNFSVPLKEYNIDLRNDVRAVATSAVREARNADELVDRIYMATDINVEVIDGTEVNRLTFLGIRSVLNANAGLQEGSLLVAEVGGGATEFLGLENGRVAFAHTYRLGAFRLREAMDGQQGSDARQREVLEMEMDLGIRQCREAVEKDTGPHSLLLLGGEARTAARLLLKDWDESTPAQIKVSDLSKLASRVLDLDVEKVARKYHLSFEDAQTLGPALLTYVRLAGVFKLKKTYICGVTLRDGLLEQMASGNAWSEDFVDQIMHSAKEVGRRYQIDEHHAEYVKSCAITMFRALQSEHRLDSRYEVILMVAALLHDVGTYIGNSGHHKHSRYLIEHSDLFGLGKEDIRLTALIARYHRAALPRNTHPEYTVLTREQRLVVSKLAAILRAADALDRSHSQALQAFTVKITDKLVILEADHSGEYAAEKRAMVSKGKMFEHVYGRSVVIRTKRK